MFFPKKPKLQVFVRHCHFSEVSAHKNRYAGFDRKRCHENLIETSKEKDVQFTFLLDSYHPMEGEHFIKQQKDFPVVEISEGTETGSFLKLLDLVTQQKFSKETMLYFLEDDYLHRPGWVDILLEGFSIEEADYLTLYDHRDKYFAKEYTDLKSRLTHTESCHWRETPSTTNTYAMRYGTLLQDLSIHKQFSEGRKISADHEKFLALKAEGRHLYSPLPGWSTHAEPHLSSPCTIWGAFFK